MDARKGELIGIAQPIVIRRLTTRPDLRSDRGGVNGGSLQNIPRIMSPSASPLGGKQPIKKSPSSEGKDVRRRTTSERVRHHHRSHSEQRGEARRDGEGGGGIDDSSSGGNEAFDGSPLQRRRPLYVDCAETGQRRFRVEFDAEGYAAEDTTVTLMPGSRLEIRAVQEETEGGRKSTSEFSRRIKIPEDVDTRQMACVILDGRIRVEAPLLVPAGPPPRPSSPPVCDPPLNMPVVRGNGETRTLSLCVEVGRVFRAEDVAVKCRSASQLTVCADRTEATDCSRLTASLVREFDLPERIAPQTLKAGITHDGLLKITALVLSEDDQEATKNIKTDRSNGLKEE